MCLHMTRRTHVASLIRLCVNLSHLDLDSHIINPGPQSCAPGSPSPLLRDVGPIPNAISKCQTSQPHLPLPSSKGCGRLLVNHWRSWRWRNARGDPGSGRPRQCIRKQATTNVVACFLPFLLRQSSTNAQYTHSATTTTSLASKHELEVDFLDCSTGLPPAPPPSHPNTSWRWIFSTFQRLCHHLPRI